MNVTKRASVLHLRTFGVRAFGVVLVVVVAAFVVRAVGGGESSRGASLGVRLSGEPPQTASDREVRAHEGDVYEVSTRLFEVAPSAMLESPNDAFVRSVLSAYDARHTFEPEARAPEESDAFVRTIALRSPPLAETFGIPTAASPSSSSTGKSRGARAREVTSSKEAFALPLPSELRLRVNVPRDATLTFAEGAVGAMSEPMHFVVSVVDERGRRHELHRRTRSREALGWIDASCDLSAFAGQNVELRLAVETTENHDTASRAGGATDPRSVGSASRQGLTASKGVAGRIGVRRLAPLALWGAPTIVARKTPRAPFNVLWITVDALHPDAIEVEREIGGAPAPSHAPRLAAMDSLVRRGVRFTRAYASDVAASTALLSMLSGARARELGVDVKERSLAPGDVARLYDSDPPLVPLTLRHRNVTTHVFSTYDVHREARERPFEAIERAFEHRTRAPTAHELASSAASWLSQSKDTRFFALVNLRTTGAERRSSARSSEAKGAPSPQARRGASGAPSADLARIDDAVGVLLGALDASGLGERTVVVLSAERGTIPSGASSTKAGPCAQAAKSKFEGRARIPLVLVAPSVVRPGFDVSAPVRSIDIAPTLLDILEIEPHAKTSGRSALAMAKGGADDDERVVLSEAVSERSLLHERWRLVRRAPRPGAVVEETELVDVVDDPEGRCDLAKARPELAAEMSARLDAAIAGVPVAGSERRRAPSTPPSQVNPPADRASAAPSGDWVLQLRFVGGSSPRRVSGTITLGDAKTKAKHDAIAPVELGRDAYKSDAGKIEFAFHTSPMAPVGFDIVVEPPTAPIGWELWLDDRPWPENAVFGGAFGLPDRSLMGGLQTDRARDAAFSATSPTLDPQADVGVFVTRSRGRLLEPSSSTWANDIERELRARGVGRVARHRVEGFSR